MNKVLHKLFRIDSRFWDYYRPVAAFCNRNEDLITGVLWILAGVAAWAMGSWVIGHLFYK